MTKAIHPKSVAETPQTGESAERRSHVAVILANRSRGASNFEPYVASVGALPVLLRAILGAQRAGATRIVVVADRASEPSLRQHLADTGRLPSSTEWFEAGHGQSLSTLLERLVTRRNQHLVLIDGDKTYHPALHRRASEWSGEGDALALITGGELSGIYGLSLEGANSLVQGCQADIESLAQLHACIAPTGSVEYESVPEDKWQSISTAEDRLAADRKLDRWLVKPTDGVFATANRKISIPISRQLIKFPITPNMVSLFTLGVSFLSGWYFARGGYFCMLLGAVLGLFASILDGSDGEVARLTFQESAFGCWLETICDYLYYVFTFVGMTIGLMRTSGSRSFLAWGGLLLFGAMLSFLVTAYQRQRLTAGRPEQLLTIWQAKAASRKSPGILSLAGRIEFVIRRCFLPYALLFFALFDITQVAFIMAAVGANVVWMMALYSHYKFTARPKSVLVASPDAAN
jgi:phosphatidylglycerophosphate synthase